MKSQPFIKKTCPFQDLEAASGVLDRLLDGECSSYLSPEILNRISAKINEVKGTLSTLRTGKLWLQYMDIKAYMYLHTMQSLKDDHPVVHDLFQAGYHFVRRSDRYWGGLSTDLVIEQVLYEECKEPRRTD